MAEKLFEVDVDFHVTKRLYVSAENEEEASEFYKKKLDENPYYDARTPDAVLGYEITDVRESTDDDDDDDTTEEEKTDIDKALDYVRENMAEEDMAILQAQISKSYKMNLVPTEHTVNCDRLCELLGEYGEENDLAEDWWEDEYDMADILAKI